MAYSDLLVQVTAGLIIVVITGTIGIFAKRIWGLPQMIKDHERTLYGNPRNDTELGLTGRVKNIDQKLDKIGIKVAKICEKLEVKTEDE